MGKKIVIELTNRCNLRCRHCFSGRHGGRDDLPFAVLRHLLAEAHHYGFEELSFTGGDPTVYRYFPEALQETVAAGYRFALNTNGWNFAQIYSTLLPYQAALSIITFSLDGATEATHDQLRGQGSFRRVMQAMSICVVKGLPFSINMVVTAHNRHEIRSMVTLGERLGARGVRFGHLMPEPSMVALQWDLTPAARRIVEEEIRHCARQARLPVVMAPGYFTAELFPCAPLHSEEINVNCQGEVTVCCHLSGHGDSVSKDGVGQDDVIGSLVTNSFGVLYQQLVAHNERFRATKLRTAQKNQLGEQDHFPCWYCSQAYDKVRWLEAHPAHPWH